MGLLDQVISLFRAPVEALRDFSCADPSQARACSTLTALSQAMGGEAPQRLASISTFTREPLSHPVIPQTLTGCYMETHVAPLRRFEVLYAEGLERIAAQNHTPRETPVGCYIQYHEIQSFHPIRTEEFTRTLDRVRSSEPHVVAGCYMTVQTSVDSAALRRDLERLRRPHH